mmetsp:Transcript_22990/g.35511  ORF Transcript_22990/g.35511 Transcript_22990/m.35511 type:complete len:84 (+) Transcript_22990:658-909(+)
MKNDLFGKLRLILFYADDVVEKIYKMKSEFFYIKPAEDGENCCHAFDSIKLSNEKFKQELREKEGIFFDVNVSPSSPRKMRGD